jgi:integrase
MGRPPLPLGTPGAVRTYRTPVGWRARTKYRDFDGVTREVERVGRTEGAAKRALAEAIRDRVYASGTDEIKPDSRIAVVAEAWIEGIKRQADEGERSPNTHEAYRGCLDRQILPALGQLRIRELKPSVADRFILTIQDKHGAGSAKTARSVLSGIASYAVRHDALEINPTRNATPISRKSKKAPVALELAAIRQLRAFLTYDDWAIAHDLPDLVNFMAATGLRIGEAIGVVWDAVNLDAGTIEVRATVIRITGEGLLLKPEPKSEAGWRALRVPQWCIRMLKARAEESTSSMVFPSPRGHLRDPKNTNRDLRRVYDNAGCPDISSHVFRKSVATLMDEAGLSSRKAADQLGHAQVSMTQNSYYGRKVRDTGAAEVLEAIGE